MEATALSAEENPSTPADNQPQGKDSIELMGSPGFVSWLHAQDISLAFSSYQLGKFFLIGRHLPAGLSVFQRNFARCMGIAIDNHHDAIYLSSLHQIWKFTNCLPAGDDYKGYDRLYSPKLCYFTGEIDAHDMAITADGQLIFVNTLFSCIATVSDNHSFKPLWKPRFISKLVPEDRCHLNGLALENGQLRYVTCFSQTNSPNGWREHKNNGGCIIDTVQYEIICHGLSMPHSPRMYNNKLWVLNSGTGHLGYVDLNAGRFQEVAFLPGYLRGLQFVGDYAIVGLSHLREKSIIAASQLEENISKHNETVHCGIYIVNINTGEVAHYLELGGNLGEIFDIAILPNVFKPMAIGIEDDGIRRVVFMPENKGVVEQNQFLILENIQN